MTTVIEDDRGHRWAVGAGDPARTYVLVLEARGFTYVVLPAALLTGTPDGGIMEVERAAQEVPMFLPPAENGDATRLVRRARLIDCIGVLLEANA